MLKLLHGADFHLDSPFAGLTPEAAQARRRLQRRLPLELAALCKRENCGLVLLAGDLFDSGRVTPESVEALQQGLEESAVPVFIAPGNHDYFSPRSPWQQFSWPGNVHIFSGAWSSFPLPDISVRIWGAGFQSPHEEAALGSVEREYPLELGVLHGDPVYGSAFRPADIAASGLNYLALGHIHKTQMPLRAGKTWYGWPGVAMGRGFDETGVHGVFSVTLTEDRDCAAELLPLPGPKYYELSAAAGDDPVAAAWAALAEVSQEDVVRLTLTGESPGVDLSQIRAALQGRCGSLLLVDETVPPQALWDEAGTGSLRGMALSQLQGAFAAGDPDAAAAAKYLLAALEGRDAPW